MGRLWDDHFGDLGYLPKFDGVQDARFTINSPNGHDVHYLDKKKLENQKDPTSPHALRTRSG